MQPSERSAGAPGKDATEDVRIRLEDENCMTTMTRTRERGRATRRITRAQRQLLLHRIKAELADVTEDIAATAETLRMVRAADASLGSDRKRSDAERIALLLLDGEQHRQRLELGRLYAEHESLALRREPRA